MREQAFKKGFSLLPVYLPVPYSNIPYCPSCLFSLAYIKYGSPLSLRTPHTPVLLLSSGVICTECFLLLPAGFCYGSIEYLYV